MARNYIVSPRAINNLEDAKERLFKFCHAPGCPRWDECPGNHALCRGQLDGFTAIAATAGDIISTLISYLNICRENKCTSWKQVPLSIMVEIDNCLFSLRRARDMVALHSTPSNALCNSTQELDRLRYLHNSFPLETHEWGYFYRQELNERLRKKPRK